jgi:hypothetical protein
MIFYTQGQTLKYPVLECVWNVMAHAQKPDFVFRRNGRVHVNRRWRQFSRLLAAEVCASAVVMLDTPRSEVVWRVLATHYIRQFPLHFPSLRHRVPSHFNWVLPQTNYRVFVISLHIPGLSAVRTSPAKQRHNQRNPYNVTLTMAQW